MPLLMFLVKFLDICELVLVVYALMSWFPDAQRTKLYEWLVKVIEPVLSPIRKLPLQFAGVDFSILILFLVLALAKKILFSFV